jgi:purine-nucleoside phosphorylase
MVQFCREWKSRFFIFAEVFAMEYNDLISGIKRFGAATNEDLCLRVLGTAAKKIQEHVVITPGWGPEKVPGLGKAELISSSGTLFSSFKVWNIKNDDIEITYINTGFGAPVLMDALLSLGMSNCKNIIFISSVGALDSKIGIGDLVIPEYSICGDGASRYIASDQLGSDVFGEKAYPDMPLLKQLKMETENICKGNHVKWHMGKTFCTDTIFAQFAHMDQIIGMGCNTVDMETAVAFRAAKLMKKPLAALFSVSDNTTANKSLMSERPQDEIDHRKFVRGELLPKIILNLIKAGRRTS